ncbi:MAG: glutamate-5-semialdehyde dehydrogenase [Dehalococcoidia bacterium]
MTSVAPSIRDIAGAARGAARQLAQLHRPAKDAALIRIAELLETDQDPILAANAEDIARVREAGAEPYFVERLTLTSERLNGIARETRQVAALDDPVGEVIDARTLANGLQLARRRVPLGVIACIYESRPNVTIDIATLCLKSGNAVILRGGKEAQRANTALGQVVARALAESGLPGDAVQVISDPDRALIDEILQMPESIDLVIPRGGQALQDHVRDNSRVPYVVGGVGVVHIYVDRDARIDMALDIVDNAKRRRYSICNAVDTVLVHEAVAPYFLPKLAVVWAGSVTALCDERALEILAPFAEKGLAVEPALPEHWDTEHLALRCGIRVVDDLEGALGHIEEHGSGHSEAIVTERYDMAMRFLDEVDSAVVYVNASTQFTDGAQFGLGAEVAISTGKVHARGPLGLRELTSYKWTVMGQGQVRPK